MKRARVVPNGWVQLELELAPVAEPRPGVRFLEEPGDYPEHRLVRATECAPAQTRGYRSVWDLAVPATGASPRPSLRMDEAPGQTRTILRRIERMGQVTRHVALREQETAEWREREERRRARQRPPKPQKQRFKMRNSLEFNDAGKQ